MARRLPKVLVFDLDGCTWWPEMYHLWGGGGSPFTPAANGNVKVEGAIKEFWGFKATSWRKLGETRFVVWSR